MDSEFQIRVATIRSLLEVCNKQQISLYTDVLDVLIAYIEEIVLMMHIHLGPTDSVNVAELLYQDIESVCIYIKVSTDDDKNRILKDLKTFPEDRLSRLHKRLILLRKHKEAEIIMLKEKKFETRNLKDLNNITDFMLQILQKIQKANLQNDVHFTSMVHKMNRDRKEYCIPNEVDNVDMITKRTIGRLIIQNVGNEGYTGKEYLRRQFQAVIDYLQKESPNVWTDASITVYDDVEANMYKITSGNGKHQFICSMRDNEPYIRPRKHTQQPEKCVIM